MQAHAEAVVSEAWTRLQTQGWDHPAWREAYCLGQLCLACAYSHLDSITPVQAPRFQTPDEAASPDKQEAKASHAAPLLKSAATCNRHDPAGSPQQILPAKSAHAPDTDTHATEQQPCLEAMRVLDLAMILGTPSTMVQPLVNLVEPRAHQCLQATLAHQTDHACCTRTLPQLSDAQPTKVPEASSARSIARRQLQDLSPADFKKLFWKTDTPVVITGTSSTALSALRSWLQFLKHH